MNEITETLSAWGAAHPERPAVPYAINQIVHKRNNRLEQELAACEQHKDP
jgi:nitronate monooxygenase